MRDHCCFFDTYLNTAVKVYSHVSGFLTANVSQLVEIVVVAEQVVLLSVSIMVSHLDLP